MSKPDHCFHFISKGEDMKHESLYDYSGDPDLLNEFREMVAINAYYRAEKRNFEPGHEMDDWYEAELEITSTYRYWFQ